MTFNSSLSAESTWMTYFVQIVLGYLVTWTICALIQRPAIRSRLWRCFLFLTVAGWLALSAPAPDRAVGSTISSTAVGSSALRWSLPVTGGWAHPLDLLWVWTVRFYLVILALSLFQMFVRRLRLEALRRSGQLPSPELGLVFQRLRREMKVGGCKLILTKQLRSPGTAGWYRPHVFLPMEMVPSLTSNQLLDILRHELIHVRDRDYLWDRLVAIVCRLVCFHPAVWLAHRQLRREMELACDQEVVAGRTESRLGYAECLTNMARWRSLGQARSVKGIGFSSSSASLLATRVRALLREPSPRSLFQQVCRTGAVGLMVVLVVFFLPGVGLTFYWSVPHSLVSRRSSLERGPSAHVRVVDKDFRKRTQRALSVQQAEMRSVDAAPNQLSSLFAEINARPMPVLANSSMSGSDGARSASTPNENGHTGSQGSDPIWNQSSSTDAPPSWGDVANTAIRVGVSLTPGEGGSHTGRPDRDPDPRRLF
jgi:beta-lactamase regulating signal transducer with metallopeptidase domain